MSKNASRDNNRVTTLLAVSSVDLTTVVKVAADPTTHRLLVDSGGGGNTFQTDTFTSTNNQTIFTASATVVYTLYLSINGAIQTPNSDYSVTGNVATLSNGIPSGSVVVWLYTV